jgi:hypothetical protein
MWLLVLKGSIGHLSVLSANISGKNYRIGTRNRMFKLVYQVMKVYDRYQGPRRVFYAEFKNKIDALKEATALTKDGIGADGRINFTGELVARISWK